MPFVQKVPGNAGELEKKFKKLHKNKKHIKSIQVNESNNHIEVDLDAWGNLAFDDFYVPIKKEYLRDAKDLVKKILDGKDEPSPVDIRRLYEMIDRPE